MSLVKIFQTSLLLSFLALGAPLRAETLKIFFKTSPHLNLLRPFADPVNLTILVTGPDGRPLDRGTAQLRLDAPGPGRVFSTDFPIVEGSRLLDLSLPLRAGKAEWKYLFPIRGEYRLAVEILNENGTLGRQTFQFKVRENERKWLFLALFTLLLFAFGWLAGRIFTGAPLTGVKVLVFLLAAFFATLHIAAAQSAGSRSDAAGLDIDPAPVGKLSHLRWRLANPAAGEIGAVSLTLTITHLEKAKIMFAVERLRVQREFAVDYQFPDGAEYRVTAVADVPGRGLIRSEQLVAVAGIEPPASAMIAPILLFVAVIASGLLLGRWTELRKTTV